MDSTHEEKAKPKRSCLKILLLTAAILSIVGMLGYYYWPHFLWKYAERKLGSDLKKIPVSPMPEGDIQEDWTDHSLGCLRYRLPPDMTLYVSDVGPGESLMSVLAPDNDNDNDVFFNDNLTIIINLHSLDRREILEAASRMHPGQKTFSTMTQLRNEACGVAADDFRWSMTHKEAAWHTFIVSIRHVLVLPYVERAESFSGRNWEGLLMLSNIRHHYCEWECLSCNVGGAIGFVGKNGQNVDIEIVKSVIQSMEVDCDCSIDKRQTAAPVE